MQQSARNLEIDRLRAVAVLFVMWQHQWGFFPWHLATPRTGWMGVDLFFVISGFVVTKSLISNLSESAKRGVSISSCLAAFYVRRFFRLAPCCLLWLLLYFLLALLFNRSGAFGAASTLVPQMLAILSLSYNYYLAGGGEGSLVWHWSLSAEEQFYLLYPLFLLAIPDLNRRIKWLGVTLLASALLIRPAIYSILYAHGLSEFPHMFVPPYFRNDGLLMGCLLFFGLRRYNLAEYGLFKWVFRSQRIGQYVGLFLGGLLFLVDDLLGSGQLAVTLPIVALTSSGLVFLAQASRGIISFEKRIDVALDWIGKRSYIIYLCHFPMYRLNREIWSRIPWGLRVDTEPTLLAIYIGTAFLMIAVSAELTHRLVEAPGMRFGGRASEKLLLASVSGPELRVSSVG